MGPHQQRLGHWKYTPDLDYLIQFSSSSHHVSTHNSNPIVAKNRVSVFRTVDHAWSGQFCTDSAVGEAVPGNVYAGTAHALSDHNLVTATFELPVSSPLSSSSPARAVAAFGKALADFQSIVLDDAACGQEEAVCWAD